MSEPSQRSAIASSSISVILFAQALSAEITDALDAWRQNLKALGRPYEILLIQATRIEGSSLHTDPPHGEGEAPDEPVHPARQEHRPPEPGRCPVGHDGATVFCYDASQGFRSALNDAIRAAQYPLLVFSTADKQYRPADLDIFLKVIDKVDLVTGYRAGGQAPAWRVILDAFFTIFCVVILGIPPQKRVSWLGAAGWQRRWIARWLFGLRVTDPECAFRLARRSVFERLPIQSGGPFVQIEILAKLNHKSCLFAEEPVAWSPPSLPEGAAISFGHDARLVFRDPHFS